MVIDNCKIKKSGIPRIEIPVRLKDLTEETIKYYLPQCISALEQNARKIKHLSEYVDGSCQDIDNYQYGDNTSGKARHKIKENHAYEIVQFKEGFYCGEPIQFTNKKPDKTVPMNCFANYLADVDFNSKVIERWHNQIATGTAITFIMPRGDIFTDIGEGENRQVKYKTADDGYNVEVNSPFIYEVVSGEENAIVYSSCIGEPGLKDLFCFNVATVQDKQYTNTNKLMAYILTLK
jgi:hypothetical protein